MGVVNRGVAVGDFHAPPAFERREQHEQIRDSITLVLVVVARLAPRLSGNSRARLKDQLFRGFVETHDGALRITRPLVDFQHVFHVGNEGRVGLRRDHPLLLEMRLENVFLRVRPIVLSLAHRTMLSSTTFCSRRRRLHLACPAGAGPHVSAISFPLPRRRIIAGGRGLGCICGSAPTQTPPRPIGVLSARYWRCWYPEPRRSGCHSSHRQLLICRPSAEYAPSSTTARDACPRGSSRRVALALPRSTGQHIF